MTFDRPTFWGGDPVARPTLTDVGAAADRIRGQVGRAPSVPSPQTACVAGGVSIRPDSYTQLLEVKACS